MPDADQGPTTRLLNRFFAGDSACATELAGLVYDELRKLAYAALAPGNRGTIEPTALVHEAWLRLSARDATFENRRRFYAFSARVIRSVLVDSARARSSEKRGGRLKCITLTDGASIGVASELDFLDLHDALEHLRVLDESLHGIVELRFFSGLGHEDIADVLGISLSTVEKRWRLARAWLRGELGDEA